MEINGRVKMLDYSRFREIMAGLLESRGLRYTDLGAEIGYTKHVISRYMTGERTPTIEFLYRTSRYFDTTIDFLLGLTNDKRSPLTGDALEVSNLFSVAADEDKVAIKAILSKYKKVLE